MKNFTVILLMLSLLFSFENKAQIIFESQPIKIDFKNPYKFNSIIEKKLENKNQIDIFQAFLDYSIKGDFRKAQELDDAHIQKKTNVTFDIEQADSLKLLYTATDAVHYIITKAKNRKVTIINEAHHNPRHRVFTMSLLKKLYDSGYTHFGVEALYNGPIGGTSLDNGAKILDEKDSLINVRKYPIQKSGSYIKEPQFGNLIRYALELGFTIFSYEKAGVGSGYSRELGQAKNIQKVIKENPNAKVLIHCGFAHAYEGDYEAWGKAMAGMFKELTGIDPLTIDQVKFSEYSNPEFNALVHNAFSLKKSTVLINENEIAMKFVEKDVHADIAVFHPPTKYIGLRPSWLIRNEFKNVDLDLTTLSIDTYTMILAYKKGEDIGNAIPVDILEVDPYAKTANLVLKQGKYTIVITNIKGLSIMFDVLVN